MRLAMIGHSSLPCYFCLTNSRATAGNRPNLDYLLWGGMVSRGLSLVVGRG